MRWLKRFLLILGVLLAVLVLAAGGVLWWLTPAAGPPLPALVPPGATQVVHVRRATDLWAQVTANPAWERLLEIQAIHDHVTRRGLVRAWEQAAEKFEASTDRPLSPQTLAIVFKDDLLWAALPSGPKRPAWFAAFRTGLIGNAIARLHPQLKLNAVPVAGVATGLVSTGRGDPLPFAMLGDVFVVASSTPALTRVLIAAQAQAGAGAAPAPLDPDPSTPYRVALKFTPDAWPAPAIIGAAFNSPRAASLRDVIVVRRGRLELSLHDFLLDNAMPWFAVPYPVQSLRFAFAREGEDILEERAAAFNLDEFAQPDPAEPTLLRRAHDQAATLRALMARPPRPWPLEALTPPDVILARSWQPHAGWWITTFLDRLNVPPVLAGNPQAYRALSEALEDWAQAEFMPQMDDVVAFVLTPQPTSSGPGTGSGAAPAFQWIFPAIDPERAETALAEGLPRRIHEVFGLSRPGPLEPSPYMQVSEVNGVRSYELRTAPKLAGQTPALAFIHKHLIASTSRDALLRIAGIPDERAAAGAQSDPFQALLREKGHFHLTFQAPADWDAVWRFYSTLVGAFRRSVQKSRDRTADRRDFDEKIRSAGQVLRLVKRYASVSTLHPDGRLTTRARWRLDESAVE